MRESVKNKKKWIAIATILAIVFVLSLTIGLLVSSMGKSTTDIIDGASATGDWTWSSSQIGTVDKPTTTGTAINSVDGLRSFLTNATSKNDVGYLTDDIYDFKWTTNTTASNNNFKGTLYGNGHTIHLRTWNENWAETAINNADGTTACSGLFVAVNSGVIRDVKFTYSGITRINKPNAGNKSKGMIWVGGIICGENASGAVIENVSLTTSGYVDGDGKTQRSYVGFHFSAGAGTLTEQRIIVGGFCGKQDGTLKKVYASYNNTQIEADAKNSNHVSIGSLSGPSLHYAAVGGIYGAFTGETAAKNTKNLMVKADGSTLFQCANTFTGSGANSYIFKTIGSVAGVSLLGVEGVVWDFRGEFVIKDGLNCNSDGQFVEASYKAERCAAAWSGVPTGFYSPICKYPILNGATEAKNSYSNIFKHNGRVLPTTDNYPHYDTSDTALEVKDTSNKIMADNYASDRLGDLDLNFTDTAGELQVSKTIPEPDNKNITAYDVFWRAGFVGEADDVNFTMAENKKFSNKMNIITDDANRSYEVISGKKLGKLKLVSGQQTYTGQDFFQLYAKEALTEYELDLATHLGMSDLTLDTTKCKFLVDGNENKRFTTLIYPEVVGNLTIKTTQSGERYKGYAYVDLDRRFVCEETELTQVTMLPADLSNNRPNAPYQAITYASGWTETKDVQIKVLPSATFAANTVVITDGSKPAVIDRIDYRRVGTEAYTSVTGLKYINTGSGDRHQGVTFTITETTPTEGAEYEMIAYHGDNPVAFSHYTTGPNSGTMSGAYPLGKMYIDDIDPNINIENVAYLADRWYNQAQNEVKVTVSDANSGIDANTGVKVYIKSCLGSDIFADNWSLLATNKYTFDGSTITFSFQEHAKYYIELSDRAGNKINSEEFTVKVDTKKPVIKDVKYYYLDNSGQKQDYVFSRDGRITQTIFAQVSVELGHSGGMLTFYANGDEDGEVSTRDNVVQHTADGVFTAAIQKAGTPKADNPDEFDPVSYVFYVTPVATDDAGENPIISDNWNKAEDLVSVGQIVLTITIDKLDINSLTKTYDGTADFTGSIKVLGSYNALGENKDKINDLVNISGRFIRSYEGTGTYWEDVKDSSTTLVLIIEMYAKTGYNFAIANNQAQNNIYPFLIGQEGVTYTVAGKEVASTDITEIGILKKEIKTLKVQSAVKTYWEENPKFSVKVGDNDLVTGDTIADLDIEYRTVADKKSSAGVYDVFATVLDSTQNYYFNNANVNSTRGELRIMRAEIKNIIFENDIKSITCFEVPNVKAYFYTVENKKQYLQVIYKNQDREEIEFISGKRAELGTYYYIVLLDSETLKNYANESDPNMLIGRFDVTGEIVKEGISYTIRDLDPSTPEIEVMFVNRDIDFRTLINFKDVALSYKIKIYYGAEEAEKTTINQIGTTYVTIKLPRGDNKYAAFTKEYKVKVVKANVVATNDDLIAPTEKVEAGQEPINGVYFTNTAVNLTPDNISAGLTSRLEALLTDKELSRGGVNTFFTFNYSYLRGAKDVDAENVKDQGDYTVNLTITGSKINPIQLQTSLKILTREVSVKFDFDKYAGTDVKVDKDNRTITKVFSGLEDSDALVLSLDSEFEAELRRLFSITDETPIENIPYQFSANNFIEAMNSAREVTFGYKFGINNNNVRFIDNTLKVQITQKIIDLSIEDVNEVYSGGKEIFLSEADIAELIRNGVTNPYSTGNDGLYFGVDIYPTSGITVIIEEPEDGADFTSGKIGLRIPNAGEWKIAIRMKTANNNFRIGNGVINIKVDKAPVSSVSFFAEYFKNGAWTDELLADNKTLSIGYTGNIVKIVLNDAGKAELDKLGVVYEGENSEIEIKITKQNGYLFESVDSADFKNAGTYRVVISITNDNISSEPFNIDVVINKKQIGEYTGMFNPDIWYIDGNRPEAGSEAEENGLMYTRRADGTEAVFSYRLVDEAELEAAGFEIVYKYNGVEADGVTTAGSYKVTAEITYAADPENWAVKVVELWKLDSNGQFVYTNKIPTTDKDNNPLDPNDNAIVNKVKQVVSMDIAKADLQTQVDKLDTLKWVLDDDKESFTESHRKLEYNGQPHKIDFTAETKEMLKNNLLRFDIKGNEQINANEYSVVVYLYKLKEDGVTKDPNYDSAEIEQTLTISPRQVKIIYELDESYKFDGNGNAIFDEKAPITVNAYYVDLYGRKIKITSFVIESVKGEGEDAEYSTVAKDKIKPGLTYQVTASIGDGNYTFDEEDFTNFFHFKVKNQTATTNTVLYILLAIFIILLIIAALVVVYMKRMYNPAVQEVDIDY